MTSEMPHRRGGWLEPAPSGKPRLPAAELRRRMDALAGAPMFADIPKRHLKVIAEVTAIRTYAPGAVLMAEGAPGSSFMVILEGRANVVKNDRTVAKLGPGDFMGEVALVDPGPRTATVVARDELACLDLAGRDFRRILEAHPQLAMRVLRGLAHRLRSMLAVPN